MANKSKIAEAVADSASDRSKRAKAALDKVFSKRMSVGSNSDVDEVIPTGIEVLDRHVLGIGGWPVKRVSELFSDPSAGKTSLGFSALSSTQKLGGMAILIETEDALQVARATVFGVDLDDVFLSEPGTIEGVLEGMREGLNAIPVGVGPNLIVWDSIATASLQEVDAKGQDAKGIGRKAKLMSDQFPSLTRAAANKRTAMLLVNQTRTKIGLVFGNPTTTPGGETHKFSATVRLQMWAGSAVKKGDEILGIDTTIKCVKHKLAIPFAKAKLRLLFNHGWDDRWSTINHAKELDLIKESARVGEETYQEARHALGWEPR